MTYVEGFDVDFLNDHHNRPVDISEYEFAGDIELFANQASMSQLPPHFVKRCLHAPQTEMTSRQCQTDRAVSVRDMIYSGPVDTKHCQVEDFPYKVPMPVPIPYYLFYNPDKAPPEMPPLPPKPKRQYFRRKPLPPRPTKIPKTTGKS